MSRIEVRPVTSGRELRQFIGFPYRHYSNDPFFVPQLRIEAAKILNPKKNAFFEHGSIQNFLAYDDGGRIVGRIAAILNGMHLEKYKDDNGFFGFFESVDDESVSTALFDAAGDWLRSRGMKGVRGPVNPSMNDIAGLLVGGFESPPYILMAHNPPYYERLLTSWGFTRAMTMWAYFIHRKYANIERLRRGVQLVHRRNPGLTIRNLDMKRFDEEVRQIRDIYNDAWHDNWGHVGMTEGEFKQLAADMKQILDPRMAFILELNGEAVGFSIAIPNLNQVLRRVRGGRLFPTGIFKLLLADLFGGIQETRLPLLGIKRKYHGRGFDAILILETGEKVPPLGFPGCEMSWILDSNPAMKNALETLGGIKDKEYAMFERAL